MEKRMNFLLSLAIKSAITAVLFYLAHLINLWLPNLSSLASAWIYTAAGLTSYLMFGIMFDRLSQTGWARFMGFNLILVTILLLVAFISLFGVFTGPAGHFCGWPAFTSAMIIFVVTVLGFMGLAIDESERYESVYGT
jgi:hypothetical protein